MTLEEAKAYLRVETDAEDAQIEAMITAARETCEGFVGGPLVRRELTATVAGGGSWQRLEAAPVWAIGAVEAVDATGTATPLAADSYAIDIDARGEGWVRAPGDMRVRVSYQAGLAADAAAVPESIAQGVIRLAAHLYTVRDTAQAPPAAVTALWRPWRRMRIGDGARP
jgi:uncharacterized phiE125 gp8 family phage protein